MKKNNFRKLSSGDLDKLLNQAFLDLDLGETGNEAMLESISNRILAKQSPTALWISNLFSNPVFLVLSILSFAASVYHWKDLRGAMKNPVTGFKTEQVSKNVKKAQPAFIESKLSVVDKSKVSEVVIQSKQTKAIFIPAITNQDQKEETMALENSSTAPESPVVVDQKKTDVVEEIKEPDAEQVFSEKYVFPNLTQKQIKENNREKKWLIKIAAKLKQDKSVEKYCKIPASPDKSISEFYMASGEITNLAYRTFLFDLLINKKKEEFLIAKPHQNLWINAGGVNYFDTLSAVYFSSERYDLYPVVNIPVAGARMYCEWLTDLVNLQRDKDGKQPIVVRLPYEKEWLYAASVGHKEAVYPWFTDSIQNDQNRFLANFCIKKQTDKLKHPVFYPNGFNPNAYTAAGMASNNLQSATIETWSYLPNDFQLYNMCGNVSELVYTENKNPKTKGGNWNSDFDHLKLNSEDEFKDSLKPSPMIGFRVCITEQK